jgi:transposase
MDITERCPTEDDMRARVTALNEHRRSRTAPMSNEEKRAKVEAELRANPGRSDRAIAESVGVMHDFVGRVRARLETQGVVSKTTPSERESANGKVGEGQRNDETRFAV